MEANEWIPMRQQQPAFGQEVIVFESANRDYNAPMRDTIRVATWREERQFTYSDGQGNGHLAWNVTHWMPLPPSPANQKFMYPKYSDELPDTKLLTYFSKSLRSNPPAPHGAFTQSQVLSFQDVKEWLAKGYKLESFETIPVPGSDKEVTLNIILARLSNEEMDE